jgi:flagellar motor switch protein FliM
MSTEGHLDKEQTTPAPELAAFIPATPADNFPPEPPPRAPERAVTPRSIFPRLSTAPRADLRKFRARQEEFARHLRARLSGHLHLEIGVNLSRLETLPFGILLAEFSYPTHLTLLRLEPLNAACFLEIPAQVGLSLVDRELGGPGKCHEPDRALTEIESNILTRLVELIAGEWCDSWSDIRELRAIAMGVENNPAFMRIHPADAPMLAIGFDMQLAGATRQLLLAFPYAAVEPLIQHLNARVQTEKEPEPSPAMNGLKWNTAYDDVSIRISAELPSLKISTKEVATLKAGDVISLNAEAFQQLQISLARKPKFVASAGRSGTHWAAKITQLIEG